MDDTRREGMKASFLSFEVAGAMGCGVVVQSVVRFLDGIFSDWKLLVFGLQALRLRFRECIVPMGKSVPYYSLSSRERERVVL